MKRVCMHLENTEHNRLSIKCQSPFLLAPAPDFFSDTLIRRDVRSAECAHEGASWLVSNGSDILQPLCGRSELAFTLVMYEMQIQFE